MQPTRVRCVLFVAGGASRRVGPNGVLIGRQPDCDIVAADASVSRRHALVRLTTTGAELVPLGRGSLSVNGKAATKPRALAHGDTIALPGLELGVELDARAPESDSATFVLERNGARFGIAHTPFVIGGGADDDLIVTGWPARAIVLHVAQHELYVERDGALDALAPGDELAHLDQTFRVARAAKLYATTTPFGDDTPRAVTIEMLPRGGRIVFGLASGERAVYLADRRFDLVVALLQPPKGFRAGEPIPDEVVRAMVWPRKQDVSRQEINMLISRARRDLVEAGLAGPRLIERAPGGGATRFVLHPRAEIVVKS